MIDSFVVESQISNLRSQISDFEPQDAARGGGRSRNLKSQIANLKSQISDLRCQISEGLRGSGGGFGISDLRLQKHRGR